MRSFLFVPADGGKKLDKAMASGADAVIVDLEDSIAPEGKARARELAAAFVKEAVTAATRPSVVVRVNGLTTGLIDDDLAAIVGLPDGHVKIVAIATETAQALFLAGSYRGASPRLTGLTWGAEDLSAELGAEANRDAQGEFLDPYRLARSLCLAAAAAAEVPALDTVYVDFRNEGGLRR